MPPQRIVGQLFCAEGEAERLAQDRLAKLQSLGVEVGAVRRFGECDVVDLGHCAPLVRNHRQQAPRLEPRTGIERGEESDGI